MNLDSKMLEAIGERYSEKGSSFRIKHATKRDGTVCTEDHKDPAMILTRLSNGWMWHCHRCLDNGFIPDAEKSPKETTKKISDIAKTNLNNSNVVTSGATIQLPTDFKVIDDLWWNGTKYNWLLKARITQNMIDMYEIGWSNNYNRIIIPVYEPKEDEKTLVGWVGRNDLDKNKSKYYTMKSTDIKRLYYWAPDFTSESKVPEDNMDTVILVEDCLSAIQVYESTGFCTVALLTTSVDDDFVFKFLKDCKRVNIWLDADALAKSVKIVSRLRQLGIKAHQIYTTKDPKFYHEASIKEILKLQ